VPGLRAFVEKLGSSAWLWHVYLERNLSRLGMIAAIFLAGFKKTAA
jgi:hypothetical protein